MGRRAKSKTSRKKMEFLRSSPTMEEMGELNIGEGMAVEVNFDRGNLQGAWFPAIVLQEVGFNSFLVEYIRSRHDSGNVRVNVTVDSSHIRPIPPKSEVQRFEILNVVEAFHDSCWKKGTIVTVFANGRYGISFPCLKGEQLFCQSEIRPCLVWMNGKWESADRTRCGGYETVDDIEYLPEIVVPLSCSSTEEKSSSGYTNDAEEKRESKSRKMDFKDFSSEAAESSKMEKGGTRNEKLLQLMDFSSENSRCHLVSRAGKCFQSPTETEKADRTQCEEQYEDADNITTHSEIIVAFSHSSTAQDCNEDISSCKSTSNEMEYAEEKRTSQLDGNVDIVCEKSNDFGQKDEGQLDGIADIVQKESNGFGQQDKGEQEVIVETFHQSSAKNVQADMEVVDQELPFTKTSSLWKYVDSLDVFRFLPQNPHFTPLIEHDEAKREGLAVGHMLFFASLVEMTSKLQVDKSRKVFDNFLVALADLETVGFDVKAVANRVNSLLSIKERKEQLKNQSECIYSEIAECDSEKAKAEEEINAIDKMISELKAKREVVSLKKTMLDSESNLLQMNENRINVDIKNAKLDYETQVAEPW